MESNTVSASGSYRIRERIFFTSFSLPHFFLHKDSFMVSCKRSFQMLRNQKLKITGIHFTFLFFATVLFLLIATIIIAYLITGYRLLSYRPYAFITSYIQFREISALLYQILFSIIWSSLLTALYCSHIPYVYHHDHKSSTWKNTVMGILVLFLAYIIRSIYND